MIVEAIQLYRAHCPLHIMAVMQALAEANEVDARAAAGEDVGLLCGLPVAIKDSAV